MKILFISIIVILSYLPFHGKNGNAPKQDDPPKYKDVEPLLKKYTCSACHLESKKLVGPSYKDIAKKDYSDADILKLIYKPNPENWPDYPPMAPMANVKKVDGQKIAAWINSLN
jgi:cytochrome c